MMQKRARGIAGTRFPARLGETRYSRRLQKCRLTSCGNSGSGGWCEGTALLPAGGTGRAGAAAVFPFAFPCRGRRFSFTANIAKNWLRHGIYGLSSPDVIMPTLSRLPGYPAFLAAVFAIFGMEHYRAVLLVQMLVDLGTCFLIADMARRMFSGRAAKAAFLLAALCPFLANYAAAR